jgi:hypothetical protein
MPQGSLETQGPDARISGSNPNPFFFLKKKRNKTYILSLCLKITQPFKFFEKEFIVKSPILFLGLVARAFRQKHFLVEVVHY